MIDYDTKVAIDTRKAMINQAIEIMYDMQARGVLLKRVCPEAFEEDISNEIDNALRSGGQFDMEIRAHYTTTGAPAFVTLDIDDYDRSMLLACGED